MNESYERTYGTKPKEYSSPLEKNDHPELDNSTLVSPDEIVLFQSHIGCFQWCVTLGRFDIATAVMTLSRYRVAPGRGHLDRAKRIFGYLKKYKYGAIRIRTGLPDHSKFVDQAFDWMYSVYGSVTEDLPKNAPVPLGKRVVMSTYKDANLYHDWTTGRAVTGILHFLNGTPVDWYSKRQNTVETATYGSEFVAARIATNQIIDLRMTLRYLGVPVVEKSYLFGDNQSVVTSSTIPHSSLNKQHNALLYPCLGSHCRQDSRILPH